VILSTILSVVTGGLGGGLLRLAPELIGLFKRKMDYKQEMRLRELDAEIAAKHGAQRLQEIVEGGAVKLELAQADAYREALKAQSIKSGIPWLDGINISVRPVITYGYFFWFVVSHVAAMWVTEEVYSRMWGPEESLVLSGILSFWFVNRVIHHSRTNAPR